MSVTERRYLQGLWICDHMTKTERKGSLGAPARVQVKGVDQGYYSKAELYESVRLDFGFASSSHAKTKKLGKEGNIAFYVTGKAWQCGGLTPPVPFNPYLATKWLIEPYEVFHCTDPWNDPRISNIAQNAWLKMTVDPTEPRLMLHPSSGWPSSSVDNNRPRPYTASLDFDTATSKPYVDVTWEDVVPTVSARCPSAGAFVDDTQPALFGWAYAGGSAYDGTYNEQTSAVFSWRVAGSGTVHDVRVTGPVWDVTLPAGTLPGKADIEWRVQVTSSFGGTAATPWQKCHTRDTAPGAPVSLQPDGGIVDNDKPVTLSWQHVSPTGSLQSAATLEVSRDLGMSWQTLKVVTGSTMSVEVPAAGLPAGQVCWRVKTANTDGIYGPASNPARIVVQAAPAVPAIQQTTTSPRPVVSWQHSDQTGYRVTFLAWDGTLYDTGKVYGQGKRVKCPVYLPEGLCTVTVEVCNAIGRWRSVQASATVSNVDTSAVQPYAMPPKVSTVTKGVAGLHWPALPRGVARCYVLRDGQPIAAPSDLSFVDRTAAGRQIYQLMYCYGANDDYYVVSDPVELDVPIFSAMLVDMDVPDAAPVYLRLHRDSPPHIQRISSVQISYPVYAGQQAPTPVTAGAKDQTIRLEYTIPRAQEAPLLALLGHRLCVKLRDGTRQYAVLESVEENLWKMDDVVLTLRGIQLSEVMPYV